MLKLIGKSALVLGLVSRQTRAEMSAGRVGRLEQSMREGGFDASHPIKAADVDGSLIIIDGHHRAAAAARAGIDKVPVEVQNVTTQEATVLKQEAFDAAMQRGRR